MDTEQHRDKVDDPSSSMTLSPQNTDDLQGIYVYQLPFPGTLPEKAQREQLAAVVRKYSKIVEIRFDAVPNNPDMSTVQAGRRFQLPPLSRRALIVFQKISTPSCEALLAELNKQIMSQCHLNASMAKSEHISALIALRNSSAGHNAAKVHQTISTKNTQQNQPSTTSEQPQQYPSKRPLTLLKIQPPAPAVKAFAMDSQTHTQPDPFHKNASRTLYVKHLDNAITEEELKTRYGKFGHILDIEVKNRNTMAPYAFIQFTNIESVANAIKAFNQQMEECGRQKKNSNLHWWGNTIVTSRLWIGRLPPNCGEQYLMSKMRVVLTQPDDVTQVIYDANFNEAIVMFVGHESTQIAFNKVKNRNITFQPERSSINEPVHHVHVDFCSEKLHDYFIDRLYGKNTEPLLSDVILAPPPDPPKCLSTSQLKKSPSPPPDPSIEGIGSKHSVARPKVLLAESQQQNATCAIDKTLSANSYSAKSEHPHHFTTTKPSGRALRDSNSMAEEASSHRERPAGKSQDASERVRSVNVKHTRSNSSSSNTSTDTYSQSPRKRWRHPPQPLELNEFTNSRHKMPKKQSSATTHTWDRKHRSQRSTERRRESRVEKKEKRRERRQSRTRQTAGNVRRTEVERSGGEIVSSGDRSKRGDYGGGAASGSNRRRREVSRVAKYKSRSKERARTKASFGGSCQLLPPPPAPPLRIDKAHEQQKKRRPSSSSDSHSSCTCSSCTSDSSSNSRSSSPSENSDSDYSSTENEADEERPSTRRSNQSKKDGLTDEPQIANSQPVRRGGTTTVEPVLIHNDPLPLAAPLEVKASGTEHPTKTTGLESEKTIHNESTEENSSSKDKDVQLQCKDSAAKDDASKKSSTASLAGQQPQPVTKVQAPKPSLRTIVCIPLEALSTPSSDPRLNRLKPSGAVAVSLDLPRFVLKLKMACSSGNRPLSSTVRADSTNLQEQLLTNTPGSAPPPSADWIKHEPEFNAEIEQKCKIKNAEQNENDSEMEKKPAGPNTLNLLAAITKRIKCVESGITELKISARPEQIKMSNFDQIESEVSRIRTELISGVSMEQLEQSIAQRSPITAQLNTASTDGGGRSLKSKTIIDGFQASNLLDFVITKGEDEAEKNSKSEEIEGGLHNRRCSFVSEPDMPTRSFSLSNEHHTIAHFDNPSASSIKVRDAETIKFDFPRHTSSAKVLRLAHEKEQLTPSTSSSASPLPKQSVDANSAFSRKPKLLTESSPNQQSQQIRTTVGIPKLKEIKLDRKPSAASLVTPVDPWATTSTPHGSTRKDKELKSERREYRSDSVGHLPITMAKDRKEGKNETIGGGLKTNHPILKKTPTTTTKSLQKQSREERKTDSAAASGAGCGGHVEQHKRHFKSKAKSVENESTSDVEKQHRKQKRKKRTADQSTSSSSDESVEGLELFNKVDIEEQKRMMKAIKSGVGFGLSMYDRVKRRSSQRPDDDHKKKTALEVLKTKHAKKKKEFSRVRLSSTSSDSDESEDDAANRKEEDSGRTDLLANNNQDGNPSSSAEDVEPAVIDDSTLSAEKQPKKQQNAVRASAEAKGANTSNLTIRRPEIAPRKPFMEEPKIKEEEEEANSSASCVDGSDGSSESESEAGDEEMDAGDRAIKKLKDELSRYRKSSESSVDEAKLFNENLARVVATAAEGCRAQSTASHIENGNSSSESSSSSSSESETEPITNRLIGNVGMSTKPPSQKRVKHLSMEDVFGADSSEESSDEHVLPAPKVGLLSAKNKPIVISSSKNDNIKKEVIVPKIKIDQKEASETSIGKEKMQNMAILAVNKQGKRTRVSSVSSVSSIEHKRFKETKSKFSAENEPTSAEAAVRDRSKSDATALKKAQLQKKSPTTGTSSDVTVLSKEERACAPAEMGKKMKQQTKTIGTKMLPKTSKNAMLMKELAKRKRVKIREEKKLNKTTLKRAIGSDKGQTSKRARTEKLKEQIVDRTEGNDKKKVGKQEELQPVKSAIVDTAQCLDVSIATKLAENDESDQRQPPSIVQQEKHSEEVENLVTVASQKNETDELMDIVAAEKMAESEFEIIDSGNVLTKVAATDKTPDGELKQQKTEEREVKNKMEEKDGQKKSEEKDGQKKSEEKEVQKKKEEEKMKQKKAEEKDGQKKKEEEKMKQKKAEEKVGQEKKEEEKMRQEKKEEEKDGQKKRGEEAIEVREMLAEEDDEEEMEAELLRRMEECNEEEAAVASLRLQSKVDRRNSQDLTQQSDDIGHILSPNEKHWKTLDMEMEKEEISTAKDDEEENKEEDKLEGRGERVVEEEREAEGTLHGQHTAVDEPTTDKTTVFKFETIERRASNESVDSHMAGVGNGFVEVDAEHLRQQKRDQDAMERLAEERRKTEETVKRMDETVDAVATNSTVLQQHDITSVPQTSPDLTQQLGSFQQLSRQPNTLQTAADAFPQQPAEGDVGDYLFPTTMGMGQAQNQQQCEAVIQTVTANPMSMNIQSQQYLQQQQPIHSLQHHFSLPSASVVADVLNVSSGEAVCKTASSSTTTTSSYPFLMPTTSTMSHHQQQQQQHHQYGQQHKLQHTHHMPQQQQHYSSLPQQKPLDVSMMESVSMSLPPPMPVGPSSAYDISATSMVDSSAVGGESSLLAQQQSVIQHQESTKNVASYQQQLQSLTANSTVYAHQPQLSSGMSDVVHQQRMANVFEGLPQDKSHLQQKQKPQSIASSMMLQQRKPSDVKQQQLQQQTPQLQLTQPQQQQFRLEQLQPQLPRLEQMQLQQQQSRLEQMQLQQQQSRLDPPQQQQSRLEQMQPQQSRLDLEQLQQQQPRLDHMQPQQQQSRLEQMQPQQSRLDHVQPQQQQPRLEQMQPQQSRLDQQQQQSRLEQLQQQQPRLDHVQPQQQQSRLEQMQPQQSRLDHVQPQQQQPRLDQQQQQSRLEQLQQQPRLDHVQPQQQQPRLDHVQPQQQQSRLDQMSPQQRQQFQMQHIVQAPSTVHKQQQLQQQQQQQYQQKSHQLSSSALTPVLSTQQVQQTKQQNVVQRQRRQQQMPTIPTQQQQQKQLAVSGQYHHQQQQQQHHNIPQQQHYQQQPDTLSTMATTGLIDPQLVSLYQRLRDQQMIQQEISKIGQAQQMPSISAAMLAAASATNQITPATLSQWHSIVTPTSTMAPGGALEELLRHGLLAPQTPSMVSPSGRTESAGTSAMAVPSSFDELFHQKLSGSSPSPRGFLQHHQQMSSNVPQRNATHMAQQQQAQQQQMQQNLLAAGGSVQNKQIQPIQQQQQPQAQQQPSIMCHSQSVEKRQQQHVHANVSLQSPPQHVFPSVEQQQQQHIVQQNQQKMVKKQSSANKYPVLWQGQLAMKNADTLVQMHKVCGNEALIQQMNGELSALNENGIPLLRINQRMRLEQTHLENLIRKMEKEENQLALICLPCGRDREDVVIQTQKMSVAFIEYFSSKSAAGIVSSGATQQPSAMVAHIFPPSDFSRMLLSRNAPDLLRTVESLNAGYLFVILTNK
uniref:RRM domain-containing protein n=1 Tax=Globodera pallida TaxID=36090 RepID=A0A183CC03_GLOPA